jgi:hypothetical protein
MILVLETKSLRNRFVLVPVSIKKKAEVPYCNYKIKTSVIVYGSESRIRSITD